MNVRRETMITFFVLGYGEPYVHECKEFAGVTVIIRTLNNPKALGVLEGYGKGGTHASRRKSEYLQPQLNGQEKSEYGDRNDYLGIRSK